MNTYPSAPIALGIAGGAIPVYSDPDCTVIASIFDLGGRALNELPIGINGGLPQFQSDAPVLYVRNSAGAVVALSPQATGVAGAPWQEFVGGPIGVVTPLQQGIFGVDIETLGLYFSVGPTSDDWVQVAGEPSGGRATGIVSGVTGAFMQCLPGFGVSLVCGTGDSVVGVGDIDGDTMTLGFYSGDAVAQPTVEGALSTVTDDAAKAVLTSIIAALAAAGVNLVIDGTS